MAGTRKHMGKIASSGGQATMKKYGSRHFQELAKSRWQLHNIGKINAKIAESKSTSSSCLK